jgi:hypothetical protein
MLKGQNFMARLPGINQELQNCIQECLSCHSTCLATVQYCIQKGGKHAEKQHIQLLLACAEICQTSANFMLAGSEFHTRTCEVCAEVCDACEKSCRQMADDEVMKACAEACKRCAESCRKMSGPGRVAA